MTYLTNKNTKLAILPPRPQKLQKENIRLLLFHDRRLLQTFRLHPLLLHHRHDTLA